MINARVFLKITFLGNERSLLSTKIVYNRVISINVQNYFQLITNYKLPIKKEKTLTHSLAIMETEKKDYIIKFYGKRGTMENFIKECKGGFRMDKVSHSTFDANENRVQQVMLAYNLINGFRRLTLPKVFRNMTIETLRVKLFKVAARCVKKARGIIFKLCSFYPYQSVFRQTLKNIQKIQWE